MSCNIEEASENSSFCREQDREQYPTSLQRESSTDLTTPPTVLRKRGKNVTHIEQQQRTPRFHMCTPHNTVSGEGDASASRSKLSRVYSTNPVAMLGSQLGGTDSGEGAGRGFSAWDAVSAGELVTKEELEQVRKEMIMQERVVRALDKDNASLHVERKVLMSKVNELTSALGSKGIFTPSSGEQLSEKQSLHCANTASEVGSRLKLQRGTDELVMEIRQQRMQVKEAQLEATSPQSEQKSLGTPLTVPVTKRLEELEEENQNLLADLRRREAEHEEVVKEMVRKIVWCVDNQEFSCMHAKVLKEQQDVIRHLRAKLHESDSPNEVGKGARAKASARIRQLTKRITELEEALDKKNPDGIAQLIRSCKPSAQDTRMFKQLSHRIRELEEALVDKDRCADAAVARLRVETDRMRTQYQERIEKLEEELKLKLLHAQSRRVQDLERQLHEAREALREKERVQPHQAAVETGSFITRNSVRGNRGDKPTAKEALPEMWGEPAASESGPPDVTLVAKCCGNEVQTPLLANAGGESETGTHLAALPGGGCATSPSLQDISNMQAQIVSMTSELVEVRQELKESQQSLGEARAHLDHCLRSTKREYQAQLQYIQKSYDSDIARIKSSHQRELMSIIEQKRLFERRLETFTGALKLPGKRSRVRAFLQSVSERLSYLEQRQIQREQEAVQKIEEIKRVADFEIALTRQRAEMMVEERNQQIQGFRLQLDQLLETITFLQEQAGGRHYNEG